MAGEPTETQPITPTPRPAVWPWLLIPLVALAMFFALRSVREATTQPAADTVQSEARADSAASPAE